MDKVYPSTPLESPVATTGQEQEHLLTVTQPPPPPSYDQATAIPAQTTGPTVTTAPGVTTHHTVVVVPAGTNYGPDPQDVQCPYCHNYARTRVNYSPNSKTHLIALVLCLLQLYCCVCLPYCITSCMNTKHYCGMCGHYLGTYVRN